MKAFTGRVGVGNEGIDVPIPLHAQQLQQRAVQFGAHPRRTGVRGAVDGAFHIPVKGFPGMVAMGAGIAQQAAGPVPRQKQRSSGQRILHPGLVFLQSGRGDLEGRDPVAHIPVINVQDVGGIGAGGHGQPGLHLPGPFGTQGLFLGFGQLFKGGFPPQRRRLVRAGFEVGQAQSPEGPGRPGALPCFVGVQPGGRVVGPAGVQPAAPAADHVDIGGGERFTVHCS